MPLKPFFHEAREIARLAHKARCVALANGFVGLCKTKGADVVVFGSLANKDAFFRVDSDIDLCILDPGPLTFREIETLAGYFFAGTKFDLWDKSDLKPDVLDEVARFGVRHFDISAIRVELRKLLGVPVDVLTPNGLPDKFRAAVLAEAMPV